MPLPKPLPRGASKARKKKRFRATLHDLRLGPHHKDRTRAQEIAIAFKETGEGRKGKRKSKRRHKRKSKRASRR